MKIQVLLRSDNNNGTLHEDLCTFTIISRRILLRMRNISENIVEEIKTHILFSITFFEKRAVYDIMWNNMVQPDRPHDNIIRRMRIACRITKATDTHTICNRK
jgi:hypothetical protein